MYSGGEKFCQCSKNEDDIDEGFLTDKGLFPMREIRHGDVNGRTEYLYRTMGPLQCYFCKYMILKLTVGLLTKCRHDAVC